MEIAISDSPTTRARVIRDLAELDQLAAGWEALAGDSSPMRHFIWSRAAAEAFGERARLSVVAVHRGGRLCAVAPLAVRRGPLPRCELIGADELGEPTELLYEDEEALQALVDALVQLGMPVLVPRVFQDSPTLADLRTVCRGKAVVLARPAPGCPQIALDDSWREPERKYSASRRSDLRRRQRIAESFGPVTFETVSPSRQQVGPLLEELLRVEDSSWKGKAGSALLRDEALGGFFRRYAEAASDKGILRFFFMRIGGRAVAGELAAQCAGRFWALKIGYDEEFRRCAPGMLLTLFTLRYAAACGLHSYEFLGSIAPWTLEWTKTEHSCSSLRLYPAGIRGFATLAAETAQWGWRKAAAAVARSTSPQPATSPEQAT